MAKKRRSRRHRAAHHSRTRRRNYRRRVNPLFAMVAPRKRHHRRSPSSPKHHRRRHNPAREQLLGFKGGGILETVGGAAAGFFGANALPSLIPQLAQYNTGITGYVLNAGSGLVISWGLGKFVSKRVGYGALIGTGLSILLRIIKDQASTSVTAAAMSGDLAYYASDRFPFPQGAGGPYELYPGSPYTATSPFPATAAAAVRAGTQAAAAALPAAAPAAALHGIGTGRWGVDASGTASRWN